MPTTTRAVTVIEAALDEFAQRTGLTPRVILLPRRLYDRWEDEKRRIDSALSGFAASGPEDDPRWCDVRVVENVGRAGVAGVEVY